MAAIRHMRDDYRSAITIRLKPEAMAKIRELARRHDYEPAQLAFIGLTLAQVLLEEKERGNKLIVVDANGTPLEQLKLPPKPCEREVTGLDQFHSDSLLRAIADLDPDSPKSKRNDPGPSPSNPQR
jgi:hypothetical protein